MTSFARESETPTFVGIGGRKSGCPTCVCVEADSIRVLRDVACGPREETGVSVPGYSGGFAACAVVSYSDLL